jgi:hypothetical protein
LKSVCSTKIQKIIIILIAIKTSNLPHTTGFFFVINLASYSGTHSSFLQNTNQHLPTTSMHIFQPISSTHKARVERHNSEWWMESFHSVCVCVCVTKKNALKNQVLTWIHSDLQTSCKNSCIISIL